MSPVKYEGKYERNAMTALKHTPVPRQYKPVAPEVVKYANHACCL